MPDPVAGDDAAAAVWMPLHIALRLADSGRFAFDHDQMLRRAARLADLA